MSFTPDVEVNDQGSIVLLTPRNDRALQWIRDNVHTEAHNWFGLSLAVEHRYAEAIIKGMTGDDLAVA